MVQVWCMNFNNATMKSGVQHPSYSKVSKVTTSRRKLHTSWHFISQRGGLFQEDEVKPRNDISDNVYHQPVSLACLPLLRMTSSSIVAGVSHGRDGYNNRKCSVEQGHC